MAKRAFGEGSLLKRKGCRFWVAQFYKDGRQIRVSTRTEVKQRALVILRTLMTDSDRGLASITDLKKITYGNLRQGLLDDYRSRGNRSLELRADGSESIVGLKQLDDFFGFNADSPGLPASRITTDRAREFARKRATDGAGPAMINRSLQCLRRMLNIAKEDGKLQYVPKIRLLKEPPPRKGFLEVAKLEQLVGALPSHLQPLVLFLYWCGVRLGEALQIEWTQVDLKARLIRLEDDQTKNAEARVVPLPAVLVDLLCETSPKVGRVFSNKNLRTEWERACTVCGLGVREKVEGPVHTWHRYRGLIVHDLRRSAIRNLVNAGVPERVAMKISGHKTRAVFDRYHIVNAADVTAAMQRVETAALPPRKTAQREVSGKTVAKLPRGVRNPLLGA